jgi:hypothetical protein
VRWRDWSLVLALLGSAAPLRGQSGQPTPTQPQVYGSLTQDDLALRVQNDELQIRFVPLDQRVTRLLARDAYQSIVGLQENNRRAIDSVASRAGVSQPGLALVSFFGRRPDVRFDAQTLTLLIRNREFRPLGTIPLTPRFTSGQLGVRDQASAIYVFEESIPVEDSFTLAYGALISSDWDTKESTLGRERARVSAKAREQPRDTSQ